ncbi:hypothetical protein, partial [Thiolapillus sp.]|uniref:hypothetical protein n=1 Tax=Thiolapillus sp. TaxID=2017437 RepID=UPI003AF884F0
MLISYFLFQFFVFGLLGFFLGVVNNRCMYTVLKVPLEGKVQRTISWRSSVVSTDGSTESRTGPKSDLPAR